MKQNLHLTINLSTKKELPDYQTTDELVHGYYGQEKGGKKQLINMNLVSYHKNYSVKMVAYIKFV